MRISDWSSDVCSSDLSKIDIGKYGQITDRDPQHTVFAMFGGSAYCFDFKKLQIGTWEDWKTHRQGRLLPPFSTRLQQKYAAYLQPTGLPTIPTILRSVAVPSTGTAAEVEAPATADKDAGGHSQRLWVIGCQKKEARR